MGKDESNSVVLTAPQPPLLPTLLKFGADLGAVDKVIKFLQSFAKFSGYFLQKNGHKDLAGDFGNFASYASTARKAFRSNKDIEQFGKLVAISKNTKLSFVDTALQLTQVLMYETFIFFDHFLMAAKVKFLARDTKRWLKVSCFGWTWACIANCVIALKKLRENHRALTSLRQSQTRDTSAFMKLLTQRKELVLNFTMNAADAICAGSIIDYDKHLMGSKISSGTYGACGMVAAALGARSSWLKASK